MANELTTLGANVPAHLQGVSLGVSTQLLAGIYTGGNRIGFKGSRFHIVVNGIEEGVIEENYLDVIFLSAAPAVSRKYFQSSYSQGENQPPTCYSADGIVPAADVKAKQSDKCATCPQNVKGSKIDGNNKYKACGYFRRLVVMLAGDVEGKRTFKFDVASQGLFGDNTTAAQNLNDYIKKLESRGVDAGTVVTRVTFDINSSVPKLLFRPSRYIDADEFEVVKSLVHSEEVKRLAEVNMTTVDLSDEQPTTGEDMIEETTAPATSETAKPAAPRTQAPQARPQPQAAAPARTQQTVQKAAPAPAQRVQQQAPAPRPAPKPEPEPVVDEIGDDAALDALLQGLD